MRTLMLLALLLGNAAQAADSAWDYLKSGGYSVIMRHSLTDPPRGEEPKGFQLDDCSTQRNLGAQGRHDAERLGAAFATKGVAVGEVYSSRYCRCQETARLAFGKVEVWDTLTSYPGPEPYWEAFDYNEILAIRKRLSEPVDGRANRILVTHNTHIKALLDIWVEPGELVIVRPQGRMFFTVVARLKVEDY